MFSHVMFFNALASLFGVTHLKLYRFVEWTGTIKPPWHWMKRNFNRIDNEIPQNEDKQQTFFESWKYLFKAITKFSIYIKFYILMCIYGPFKKLTTRTWEKPQP